MFGDEGITVVSGGYGTCRRGYQGSRGQEMTRGIAPSEAVHTSFHRGRFHVKIG